MKCLDLKSHVCRSIIGLRIGVGGIYKNVFGRKEMKYPDLYRKPCNPTPSPFMAVGWR